MSKYMQERQKLRLEVSTNVDLLTETCEGAGKWKRAETLSQAVPGCPTMPERDHSLSPTDKNNHRQKKHQAEGKGVSRKSEGCVEGRVNSVEGMECVTSQGD